MLFLKEVRINKVNQRGKNNEKFNDLRINADYECRMLKIMMYLITWFKFLQKYLQRQNKNIS